MSVRLRQIALVAADLEPAVESLQGLTGGEVCFRDPQVAAFGLVNALVCVGDAFLEVVAPVEAGTTAGRLLERRGGDGGYMVILQLDAASLAAARARCVELGVRIVWLADLAGISGTHLHPKDTGGTMLSLDAADPPESWAWAGTTWTDHPSTAVDRFVAAELGCLDPSATARRWAEVLDVVEHDGTITLDDGVELRFTPAGPRGEGLDALVVHATDRSRAGTVQQVCGIEVRCA